MVYSPQKTCADALMKANDAYAKASLVESKHDQHEDMCARRYQDWKDVTVELKSLIGTLDGKMNDRISGIYGILWTTGGATILTLLSAVGALAYFLITKGSHSVSGS